MQTFDADLVDSSKETFFRREKISSCHPACQRHGPALPKLPSAVKDRRGAISPQRITNSRQSNRPGSTIRQASSPRFATRSRGFHENI